MMEDEDDNAVEFGEETWKYRKEASILGAALVRACPDDFVDAIFNGKSESTGLLSRTAMLARKKGHSRFPRIHHYCIQQRNRYRNHQSVDRISH